MLRLLAVCTFFRYAFSYPVPVRNNVCNTLRDYATIDDNKNCYYNPDVDSTPSKLAQRYGFAFESHQVTTEDGYILTLFRLYRNSDDVNRQPVVIQHGILVNGISWIISGKNSLAFYLANNGYDVWLPNIRGSSTYSTGHVNSSISERDYWNFSYHEMGYYDLPAYLEFIWTTAGRRKKIIYMGHSMGVTMSLVYSDLRNEHAEKVVRGNIYMAPVAYIKNVRGLGALAVPFAGLIKEVTESLGLYAVGQFHDLQKLVLGATCGRFPLIIPCEILYAFATGLVVDQVRPETIPIIVNYFPSGTSIKTALHYAQMVVGNGAFQQYDYGMPENMARYNATSPPEYNVSRMAMPVHLFNGRQDFIADEVSVRYLYDNLPYPKGLHTFDLAHNDFVYGKDVGLVYSEILRVMKSLS